MPESPRRHPLNWQFTPALHGGESGELGELAIPPPLARDACVACAARVSRATHGAHPIHPIHLIHEKKREVKTRACGCIATASPLHGKGA